MHDLHITGRSLHTTPHSFRRLTMMLRSTVPSNCRATLSSVCMPNPAVSAMSRMLIKGRHQVRGIL